MTTLYFDIETTGLDPTADDAKMHVCCILGSNNLAIEYTNVQELITVLNSADEIVGHNIISFDIPYLEVISGQKITTQKVTDTKVLAGLLFPDVLPMQGTRSVHSLEAWGRRLGEYKGNFGKSSDWKVCSPEMIQYCHQDVKVTKKLHEHLMASAKDDRIKDVIKMETEVAQIIQGQKKRGIGFDTKKAIIFLNELKIREKTLLDGLQEQFLPRYVADGITVVPKRTQTVFTKDVPYTKIAYERFNPDSNDQIVDRLQEKYDWRPTEYTDPTPRNPNGKPKCGEAVLSLLDYPEAKTIVEISGIRKLIGFISEGESSWLKLEKNGRIHGDVLTTGVVTGRMSHRNPNLAQVPSAGTEFGRRCRELFVPAKGKVFVGCDASGLENRCLAHYLAAYDDGRYIDDIKSIDIHQRNAEALKTDRSTAKIFLYAFMYGAGIGKLATTLGVDLDEAKERQKQFYAAITGLEAFITAVKSAADRGFLIGIDGRRLPIPRGTGLSKYSKFKHEVHKGPNYLLQSTGAVLIKHALVIANQLAATDCYDPDTGICTWKAQVLPLVATIHDEFIIETTEELAEATGRLLVQSLKLAGTALGFRCPLDAEYKIGYSWAEVHN